jgi:predicted nucleic acid-binding protein
MLYVDTSVLVSGLTNEVATGRVQAWLGAGSPAELTISRWVVAEFSAALSIKVRAGVMSLAQRSEALAVFRSLAEVSFQVLPVEAAHFDLAARLADQSEIGLPAGDALHLAIALDHGAILCTLDKRLADAAAALGARADLI